MRSSVSILALSDEEKIMTITPELVIATYIGLAACAIALKLIYMVPRTGDRK